MGYLYLKIWYNLLGLLKIMIFRLEGFVSDKKW